MNTRFLEAFLWAARLNSFRAAAERLHITQAAISNRIASLEEEIGARVFEREPRELRLTPVGLRLLGYGERVLELQREIMMLGRTDQALLGVVRIGAIETVVHTWLVDFLRHLQSSYPGIEVQLVSETTENLHKSLRAGSIDIALQTDAVVGDGIASTPCLPMAMGWVGPGNGPRQIDPSLYLLLQSPVITMSPGSQPHLALKELFRKAQLPVGKVHCVSSIAAIVRLVRGGFGNALLPLAPVREHIDRGELAVLRCDAPIPSQRLVVSYQTESASEAIRFVAELACRASDGFVQSLPAPILT